MENKYKEINDFLPNLTKEPDFDIFWEKTLNDLKKVPLNLRFKLIDYPTLYSEVYEIIFNGFDDTDIYGYLIKPKLVNEKMPVLINYHGYGGNGGIPANFMHYVNMGISVITFDIRGQLGRTGNNLKTSNGSNNLVCNGLLDKYEYYYRAVYCDCIKAIDIVYHFDFLDDSKIILHGGSQGGALVMAVSSLDNRAKLAICDVPSNSYYEGRFESATGSVSNIVQFIKRYPNEYETVMKNLSYFDTMNMADKIKCKVLASVGLKDNVCPAKYYFATYNRINSSKDIKIYDLGSHDGGGDIHLEYKMKYILENINL